MPKQEAPKSIVDKTKQANSAAGKRKISDKLLWVLLILSNAIWPLLLVRELNDYIFGPLLFFPILLLFIGVNVFLYYIKTINEIDLFVLITVSLIIAPLIYWVGGLFIYIPLLFILIIYAKKYFREKTKEQK
jgi:hypothetical protein